jgi:quercetin dioxygenase-like cupin family protein
MIVTPIPIAFGKLRGAIYDFPEAGDILPMHSHDDMSAHITVVAKGKVKVTAGDWVYEAESGKVIDLPANQEHEFIALEPNSRIVNIIKNL